MTASSSDSVLSAIAVQTSGLLYLIWMNLNYHSNLDTYLCTLPLTRYQQSKQGQVTTVFVITANTGYHCASSSMFTARDSLFIYRPVLRGLAPISYRKVSFTTLTMFCSGSFHHTIMLFDWEINIHVCSKKIWSVTCTF